MAWSPPSLPDSIVLLGGFDDAAELTAEIVPGFEKWSSFHLFFVAGGGTFELRHSGWMACGIPDEDTIVMIGGGGAGWPAHDFVTRWLPSSSPSSSCKYAGIKTVSLRMNRLDCKKFFFIASPSPLRIETPSSVLILSQVQYQWLCQGTSPTARN